MPQQDSWPESLPQKFQREGLLVEDPVGTERSTVEAGPSKVRRRTHSGYVKVSGIIVITQAQLLTLRQFYRNTLVQGALPFTWTDPIFETVETFRYLEPMKWAPYGHRYKVELKLEMKVEGTIRPLRVEESIALDMTEGGTVV